MNTIPICRLILLPISIIFIQLNFLQVISVYSIGSDIIEQERLSPEKIIADANKEDSSVLDVNSENNYTTKIVLYVPNIGNYLIKDEVVSFNGYVDVRKGIPNHVIGLYEINDSDEDCLISEYKIKDPISTHFTFTLAIDRALINCDEDFDENHQLEFIAKSNSNYSNIVKVQVFTSKEELPIPRLEFKPENYSIPVSVNVSFLSNNLSMSSAIAFLNHYHLNDKYSDNLEKYFPLESSESGDTKNPIFINQSQRNIIVLLKPNSETSEIREPSFLNVFLKENDAGRNTNLLENTTYNLFELRQMSQDPWSFAIPLVPADTYDLIIRSFFTDIMGEFVLPDIVIN